MTGTQSASSQHVLVCLSPSPANERVVHMAGELAHALHARFTALFVETPADAAMSQKDRERLKKHSQLAESLGAAAVTSFGGSVAEQIVEYARVAGVTKLVAGKSAPARFFFADTLSNRLVSLAPELQIYLIPSPYSMVRRRPAVRPKQDQGSKAVWDFVNFAGILCGATAISYLFTLLKFREANIITVYILGVLLIALCTGRKIYSVLSSLASILMFNFFFIHPKFTMSVEDAGYVVTFAIMFTASLITAMLTQKVKEMARMTAQKAYRTEILFETSQKLQQAADKREIMEKTVHQLTVLLERKAVSFLDADKAPEAPAWVFAHKQPAGASTLVYPDERLLYLPVRSRELVLAVVGIPLAEGMLTSFEESLMSAILNECVLALEKERMEEQKNEAALAVRQEKLRADLLRTISHDLRTPLTSISGNAGILLSGSEKISPEQKDKLCQDIYDDAIWLTNLMENLLSVTRIENGAMKLNMQLELVEEVVAEAMKHLNRKREEHVMTTDLSDDLLMAWMDPRLIIQVLINLVDNAIKYTPKGSHITVKSYAKDSQVILEVLDDGPGIQNKEKLFQMFYTGSHPVADSRRGMGLGLALCKSIVEAHGGNLTVADNPPHGAVFRFTLKGKEEEICKKNA